METTLIASPSYPNSVCWSEENLLAVASGKLVTILSPASFTGPKGTITLTQNKPFAIGTVSREDLLTPCQMPICLSRNTDPCVRSISWSPAGFSPNEGCLLSVCTADGHVKLYRSPNMEFISEWIESTNVSQLLYEYHESTEFAQAQNNNSPVHQADEVELEGGLTNGKRMPRKRNAKRLRSDESNSDIFHINTPEHVKLWCADIEELIQGTKANKKAFCLPMEDNSVCRWVFDGGRLQETNFPSDIPGNRNLAKLSHLSDLCFGIAVSPGGMMLAVVRNLDTKLLNPMYQAGTQKAMVELLYGGEQNLEIMKEPLDFSDTNFTSWKSNILSCLKKYENYNTDLVIWDITILLLTLRRSNPGLVENLLTEWFSGWLPDIEQVSPFEYLSSCMEIRVYSMDTRKLHLICVICRRVILIDSKCDEERKMWRDLMVSCEKELRERLVGYKLALVIWASKYHIGSMLMEMENMGQMVQWVSDSPWASDWLKKLLSEIKELKGRRLPTIIFIETTDHLFTSLRSKSSCQNTIPKRNAVFAPQQCLLNPRKLQRAKEMI